MSENEILTLVKTINCLAANYVKGPACMDVCDALCCYTSLNIPKVLADYYIQKNLASPNDFIKSDTLNFRIKINPYTNRCLFYNAETNGCDIHHLHMKPPNCCLYPYQETDENHKCRKGYPFEIPKGKLNEIFHNFNQYFELSRKELDDYNQWENISSRLVQSKVKQQLNIPPRFFKGLQENFHGFTVMIEERTSLDTLIMCNQNPCEKDYFSCAIMCERVKDAIMKEYESFFQNFEQSYISRDEFLLKLILPLNTKQLAEKQTNLDPM